MVEAPGASVVARQVATGAVPVPLNVRSLTATPLIVVLPLLRTAKPYVTVAPVVVTLAGLADLTRVSAGDRVTDVLYPGKSGRKGLAWSDPRIETRHTHGTGCTLSSAIAAGLALGRPLGEAVAAAKAYVGEAIAQADALTVGRGHGPVHHFHAWWPASRDRALAPGEARD